MAQAQQTLLLTHEISSVLTAIRYTSKWSLVSSYYVSSLSQPWLSESVRRAGPGPSHLQERRSEPGQRFLYGRRKRSAASQTSMTMPSGHSSGRSTGMKVSLRAPAPGLQATRMRAVARTLAVPPQGQTQPKDAGVRHAAPLGRPAQSCARVGAVAWWPRLSLQL